MLVLIAAVAAAAAAAAAAVVIIGGSSTPSTPSTPATPAVERTTDGGGGSGSGDERTPARDDASKGVVATVDRTCGADGLSDCLVSLRAGVSGASADRGHIDEGGKVRVVCQRHGEEAYSSVLGRSSDIWARTRGGLYLANVYLKGPGLDPFRITLPRCR